MIGPKIVYQIRNSLVPGKGKIQRPQVYHYIFAFDELNNSVVVGFSISCQKYLECRIFQFDAIV